MKYLVAWSKLPLEGEFKIVDSWREARKLVNKLVDTVGMLEVYAGPAWYQFCEIERRGAYYVVK